LMLKSLVSKQLWRLPPPVSRFFPPSPPTAMPIYIESHGRAIKLTGDTLKHKDAIKGLKGSWNGPLKAWMFPGSRRADVRAALSKVVEVIDKDEPGTTKPTKGAKKRTADDSGSESAASPKKPRVKKGEDKGPIGPPADAVVDLGEGKFVTVSEFQGRTYVQIREFFKDDESGETRPSKKGISLSVDAFRKLKEGIDAVAAKVGGESPPPTAKVEGEAKVVGEGNEAVEAKVEEP